EYGKQACYGLAFGVAVIFQRESPQFHHLRYSLTISKRRAARLFQVAAIKGRLVFEQRAQPGEARIDVVLLAVARTFIPILATDRAQPGAVRAAQYRHWNRQDRIFAQQCLEVEYAGF